MDTHITNFSNFFAKIHLTKRGFFGAEKFVDIVVSPNLKIVSFYTNHHIVAPICKGEKMDLDNFCIWVLNNNYELKFITKNSKFKRELYFYFDDIIINYENRKKDKSVFNFDFIKSLFSFKVFIKK